MGLLKHQFYTGLTKSVYKTIELSQAISESTGTYITSVYIGLAWVSKSPFLCCLAPSHSSCLIALQLALPPSHPLESDSIPLQQNSLKLEGQVQWRPGGLFERCFLRRANRQRGWQAALQMQCLHHLRDTACSWLQWSPGSPNSYFSCRSSDPSKKVVVFVLFFRKWAVHVRMPFLHVLCLC